MGVSVSLAFSFILIKLRQEKWRSASRNSSRNAAIQWKFENNKAYEGLAWESKNDSKQSSEIPANEG